MADYKVWTAKIVVPADAELPDGFDFPPRRAAVHAIEGRGIQVVAAFTGWGGTLTEDELRVIEPQRGPDGETPTPTEDNG